MDDHCVTFDPWTYPKDLVLTKNSKLGKLLDDLLSKYCKISNVTKLIHKHVFSTNLEIFSNQLKSFNIATKAMLGHELHSLKRICREINCIRGNLELRTKMIKWSNVTEFFSQLSMKPLILHHGNPNNCLTLMF